MTFTSGDVANLLGGRLEGPADVPVSGLAALAEAGPEDLTFVGSAKYAPQWAASRSRCTLANEGLELPAREGAAVIRVKSADLAMAKVLEQAAPPEPTFPAGAHPSAVVDASATVDPGARLGPFVYVGPKASVGAGAILHPGVTLMDGAKVGAGCVIHSRCVIEARCTVGDGTILHAGCVIGADGFGYRPAEDGRSLVKIPHIGHVEIGRSVELGANCTIDRGKFGPTVVGDGCKLDNQVHVAHNCRLGRCVVIAAGTTIGGSTVIGDGAMISGQCAIGDHLNIAPGGKVGGGAVVMRDVASDETLGGNPAVPVRELFRMHHTLRRLAERKPGRRDPDPSA